MRRRISAILIPCLGVLMVYCGKRAQMTPGEFTKADSLTDVYLSLQDSMLQSWNIMINDDNQKIKAMHHLLHELMVRSSDGNEFQVYEEQLEQLATSRYDQTSMAHEDRIEEYDFASNSLVTELISLAESRTEFAYNPTLQKLVEEIRLAEQRVNLFREEYDAIAQKYNAFLQTNWNYLDDIHLGDSLTLRPLFQMTYGD